MWRLSSQDLTCHQEPFYMWEIPFTLVLTCLFPRYVKIVTASLFIASEHVQGVAECHRSIREKGTVTKAKSLFVGSLEISSRKSSHWKNAEFLPQKFNGPRLGRYPGRGYSFMWAVWLCTSVAPKSTVFQSNPSFENNHKIFSFL